MAIVLLNRKPGNGNGADGANSCGDGCCVCEQSFCDSLDDKGIAKLRSIATPVTVPEDYVLVEEGDRLDHVFCFTAGTTKIFRTLHDGRTQILEFLGRGDFLGLPGFDQATCCVKTVSKVDACLFERSRFMNVLKLYPDLHMCLLAMAGQGLRAQHQQLIRLGRGSLKEKIASFLLDFTERYGDSGDEAPEIELPMSRRDIADYLGTTVESVSRTLTRFRELGLIRLPRPNLIVILRQAALEHMCHYEHLQPGHVAIGL